MNESNTNLSYSEKAISLVKNFEGCALRAYKDSGGKPTIGYGHTKNVKMGMTCTPEQVIDWLYEDLDEACQQVLALVKVALSQGELDALVSFCFNLGIMRLAGSTLLKYLNVGRVDDAAAEFGRWVHEGKDVLSGLVKRRAAEKEMFLS